jgi:hypothetical protein
MFSWPLPELTEYEKKFVRLYRTPKLDAQGRPTGEYWPGILRRSYQIQLYSQNVPEVDRLNQGPVFTDQLIISRFARVFALTFQGDPYSWLLDIRTASGERYTNDFCLVSAMCGGTNYNANGALIGEPLSEQGSAAQGSAASSLGVLIDPNWQLVPNENLIFEGRLAATLDPAVDRRVLSVGVHVWEFPNMMYSTKTERELG